jgi:hypothetical protein
MWNCSKELSYRRTVRTTCQDGVTGMEFDARHAEGRQRETAALASQQATQRQDMPRRGS